MSEHGHVLVIGAQGVLGHFVARALHEAEWQVTRGGRWMEEADDFQFLNLDQPNTLVEILSKFDLVMSTIMHSNLMAERTILREGGLLIKLSTLRAADRQSLASETKAPKGLVTTAIATHWQHHAISAVKPTRQA